VGELPFKTPIKSGSSRYQATMREKIEFRFRAPLHLLAVCDQGMRSDGDTFVEGLPRSSLRDVTRKLTFVPAGHE
jgi:AraC family transcriptional regulator